MLETVIKEYKCDEEEKKIDRSKEAIYCLAFIDDLVIVSKNLDNAPKRLKFLE